MAKTKSQPPPPNPRHVVKRSPAKAKTYSTSGIFKKRPRGTLQTPHKTDTIVANDRKGQAWLLSVEEKEREKRRKTKPTHPIASEFSDNISYAGSTILDTALNNLQVARKELEGNLEDSTQQLNASVAPLFHFYKNQLQLPLGESKVYHLVQTQSKAAGSQGDGGLHDSQVLKQHTTTLFAAMNKFQKRIAAQEVVLEGLKKEWDIVQDEIRDFQVVYEKESEAEQKALKVEIDEHIKGWQVQMKAAADQGRKQCNEVEDAYIKQTRKASKILHDLMNEDGE